MNRGVSGQAVELCSVLPLLTVPFSVSLALPEFCSIMALLRIVQEAGHMQPSTVVSMCQALRSWGIKHGSQEGSILTSLEAAGLVSFPGVSKSLCFPLLCDWALHENLTPPFRPSQVFAMRWRGQEELSANEPAWRGGGGGQCCF